MLQRIMLNSKKIEILFEGVWSRVMKEFFTDHDFRFTQSCDRHLLRGYVDTVLESKDTKAKVTVSTKAATVKLSGVKQLWWNS